VWKKRSNFVLEKSGKPQSDFCTNPEFIRCHKLYNSEVPGHEASTTEHY